jgi:hypothetical protein
MEYEKSSICILRLAVISSRMGQTTTVHDITPLLSLFNIVVKAEPRFSALDLTVRYKIQMTAQSFPVPMICYSSLKRMLSEVVPRPETS